MLFYAHCEARENATTYGISDQRYPFRHDIAGLLFMVIWNDSISKHVGLFYSLYTFLYLSSIPLDLWRLCSLDGMIYYLGKNHKPRVVLLMALDAR